jgi:hypothetical protein
MQRHIPEEIISHITAVCSLPLLILRNFCYHRLRRRRRRRRRRRLLT